MARPQLEPVTSPTAPLPQLTTSQPTKPIIPPDPSTASLETQPSDLVTAIPARYMLQVQFDYGAHSLAVSETITYTNLSADVLNELQLNVEPNRWSDSFQLHSLTWEGGEAVSNFHLESNHLFILLPQPLQPGDTLCLLLVYGLYLPPIPLTSEATRPLPYGYTERQTNLVDWYPYIAPYRTGEGWLLHDPWSFGEHQVYEMADFEVEISLSEPVDGLMIAASAPAEQSGVSWRYQLSAGRNFVWSASHQYTLRQTQVGKVEVNSYAFSNNALAGEQVLQDSAQALKLYSELFSPYPYAMLSVVEADFSDGMEYSGLYFLSRIFYDLYDGTPQGYLTVIAAHETAHQWWYNQVGSDQALEPWLDEAMCTYSERIFYEHIYPELSDWWWAFRVHPYQPSGMIDGTIYTYESPRAYRDTVYLRGAQFLEELRTAMGDQAFFSFLSDYVARKAGQQATAEDFFDILHDHSSQDLSRLRNEYFTPVQD